MNNAITVSLKGKKTTDISDQLVSMHVEHELNKIPYAILEISTGNFSDRKYPLFDEADCKIGAELEILIRYESSGESETSIFKGIVIASKFTSNEGMPVMVLTVKDPAFRMVNSVNTELFAKKNNKQMIESVLTNSKGLSLKKSDASMAGVIYDQFVKKQNSDWDFVLARSSEYGTVISLDNGAMSVLLLSDRTGKLELEIGIDEILDVSLEENTEQLNTTIEIGYWDVKTNKATVVKENSKNANAKTVSAPSSKYVFLGLTEKKEAEAKMQHLNTIQDFSAIKGTIDVPGDSTVALMQELVLKSCPAKLNGSHTISKVAHSVRFGTWITKIGVGNISTPKLSTLNLTDLNAMSIGNTEIATAMKWEKDPEGLGRIPVKVLSFGDGKYWAFPAQVGAGAKQSSYLLPEENEQLIVGFLHGNYNQGIVLTSTYVGNAKPPAPFKLDAKTPFGFVSATGLQLIFDDEKKDVLVCSSSANSIDINDKAGITIKSKKDLKCSSSAKTEIKASSTVTVKGSGINLN